MNKKQVLAELVKNLEECSERGYVFHPKFMYEFQVLLKNATGNEKEIFTLLVKQLNFLKELGTKKHLRKILFFRKCFFYILLPITNILNNSETNFYRPIQLSKGSGFTDMKSFCTSALFSLICCLLFSAASSDSNS